MSNNKVTLIRSYDPPIVSKVYSEVDGVVVKSAMAEVVKAKAKTYTINSAEEMVELLNKVTNETKFCLCAGSWHNEPADGSFNLVSEKKLKEILNLEPKEMVPGGIQIVDGKPVAARLKRGIEQSSWLLLDADNPPGIPEEWAVMTIAERLQLWESIVPGISKCERIELRSTSSRVLSIFGEQQNKSHAWVRVSDPAQISKLKAHIGVQMVLQDLSFDYEKMSRLKPGVVVGIEARSVFDLAVMDSGRLTFCSEPIFGEGMEGYVIDDAGIEIINPGAGVLNIDDIGMPTDEELAQYERLTKIKLKIREQNGNLSTESHNQLTLDTEIERRGVVKTLREWVEGAKNKANLHIRCESPFRESKSEAAFIGTHESGDPFVYDIGNNTKYLLSVYDEFEVLDKETGVVQVHKGFDALMVKASTLTTREEYQAFTAKIRGIKPEILSTGDRAILAGELAKLPYLKGKLTKAEIKKELAYSPPLKADRPKYERDEDQNILNTVSNVVLALKTESEIGLRLAHDNFTDTLKFTTDDGTNWITFSDEHYVLLAMRLETLGIYGCTTQRLRECVYSVGVDQAIDTAQTWIKTLKWDGVKRIENFYVDYFGSEDTAYARAVGLYTWTALAGRVICPGIQADMIPVLVGLQGVRKSTGIKAISPAPEFFAEFNFGEPENESARKMRGTLVGELAELRGLRSREKEHIKGWVTRTHEQYRPVYKEFVVTFPRRLVFFGSTNDEQFLDEDTSGQRRWLPINVSKGEVEKIAADCLQLWAEGAHVFFEHGHVSYKDAESLAKDVHANYTEVDPYQAPIIEWLETRTHIAHEWVTSDEIMSMALDLDPSKRNSAHARRVGAVLRKLGYEHKQLQINGKRNWVFFPVKTT